MRIGCAEFYAKGSLAAPVELGRKLRSEKWNLGRRQTDVYARRQVG
jgi:hypothetical protein